MPKIDLPTLPKLLHSFFHEWLVEQRNASHRTVLAYRDAWRLFLRFVAQRRNKPVAALGLEHLTGAEVLAFLQHIEQERRATVNTRNCRLAALRSFFSFVADYEPRAAKQCAEVLRVPFKRTTRRAIRYLDSAEVSAILSQPDRSTVEGQRDHALMSLLYNTGARIQEALDLAAAGYPLQVPGARSDHGQRPQRTHLADLAGDSRSDHRVDTATTAEAGRADFRQSIQIAPYGFRIPFSPAPVCQSRG